MNYKLEQTEDGPRWIQLTFNKETEKVEREPLPVGESITFDPKDYWRGTEVAFQERFEPKQALKEDGTPYTFDEFIAECEEKYKDRKFKPSAWYNVEGDILHVYWKNTPSVVTHPAGDDGKKVWNIELHTAWGDQDNYDSDDYNGRDDVVGVNIWGLKKILMEAFA